MSKALGTGRANISLRVKNKSEIKFEEIKKLENYFNVSLVKILEDDINIEYNSNNIFYEKSIQILSSANEKELEFYYGLLRQGKIGIELLK